MDVINLLFPSLVLFLVLARSERRDTVMDSVDEAWACGMGRNFGKVFCGIARGDYWCGDCSEGGFLDGVIAREGEGICREKGV